MSTGVRILSTLCILMAAGKAFTTPVGTTLSGKVTDAVTEEPLPGAAVSFPDLGLGVFTDSDGRYFLEVSDPGVYRLSCQLVGYVDTVLTVALDDDLEIRISMREEPIEMGAVDVVDERDVRKESPQSVSILTQADLHKSQGQTFAESLTEIPGVTVLTTGPSIAKPVIRGLHSQRILVLNAGIPQEGQQWGGEHAPEIDPFASARIEVLKGVSGVRYGSGAIGGVVQMMPRQLPERAGVAGHVTLNGFSNNRQGSGSGMIEGGVGSGFGWRLQGSFRKAGNARTADYFLRNTGFEELNGSASAGYKRGNDAAEIYFSHFGTELGILSDSHIGNLNDLERAIDRRRPATDGEFTYDIVPPRQEISHNLLSFRGSTDLLRAGILEAHFGWQENKRKEYDAHKAYNDSADTEQTPSFDLELTTWSLDLGFKHNPIGEFFGSIGVDGMVQSNVQRGDVFLIPNFQAYSGGIFMIEKWVSGPLTLEAGGRYEYQRFETFVRESSNDPVQSRIHEYSNLSGAIGGTYKFSAAWSIGSNLGTAWRPPSLNELYSNDVHHGTAQFEIGDLDLGTERSVSVDLTLKHAAERTSGELSVYHNRMNGFIFLFPEPEPTVTIRGVFPTFRYVQTDAVLNGLDGFVEYQLTNVIRLGASVSIVRGTDVTHDEPLIYMPADRYRLIGHFHLPGLNAFDDAYLELTGIFVAEQTLVPEGVDYAEPPPGYALMDLNLGTSFTIGPQQFQLSLSVRNLFNKLYRDYLSRYRYFADDSGRNIIVRLNIPFGSI